MPRHRLPVETRRADIAAAAYRVASEVGLDKLTRDAVASEALCSTGLVSLHFTSRTLKVAALRLAITYRDWEMMRFLLVEPYRPMYRKLPKALRDEMLTRISK